MTKPAPSGGLIDDQCRLGDEMRRLMSEPTRYCGFFVIAYDQPQPGPTTMWRIRRIGAERSEPMNWAEFGNWLQVVHIGGEGG